ncbi:MAG: FAD-dependent oxidoreductase [Vulcanimicrobiaceae bacterium]|jgi:hypothetical protein
MVSRALAVAALASLVFSLSSPLPVGAQSNDDVLVVGGTPAGVAAAVAAARHGADVTLVSSHPELGGVLTDAMMDQWDLNVAPTGDATVQGGLFDEIHTALGDAFSPQDAAQEFNTLVAAEPRIHVIRNARVVDVDTTPTPAGKQVSSVRFRRADGSTFSVAANEVVDATDDGDVAALAGARFDLGRQDTGIDERMQAVTLMFTVRDVDWSRVVAGYDVARDGAGGAVERRAWGYAKLMEPYVPTSPEVVVRDLNLGHMSDGEVTVNAVDVIGVDALDDAQVAAARTLSEREVPHLVAWLRTRLPGFADATVGRYADALYVRETRHFAGVERLTADDVWDGTIPSDTIGLSSYPLDLHPVTPTDKLAYAPTRHVYGVPFGTLVPRDLANVVLASPAISATHIASGSARVIPTTIEEGEAAGDAAAQAQHDHLAFTTMARDPGAIAELRETLRAGGTVLSYGRGSSGATRA